MIAAWLLGVASADLAHAQQVGSGQGSGAQMPAGQAPPAQSGPGQTLAQSTPSPFGLDILRGAIGDGRSGAKPAATTIVPRSLPPTGADQAATGELSLVALVTEDGQRIDRGLVWRIFQPQGADGKPKLLSTQQAAAPTLRLPAGDYLINAAFGRANLTRRISVAAGSVNAEQFVLNVGMLRVRVLGNNNQPLPPAAVSIDVLADERDRFGEPSRVVTNARPGALIRLNSGLYHLVSRYGDANATLQADLTVEPGKLTEATITHRAARIRFKLVNRPGGEATPDTQWSVVDREGDIVKESAGAFPTHLLAPGRYTVTARSRGNVFRQQFAVDAGADREIEVLMR